MMIIMILSYNVSLYGLVFLSLSGFFSLMTYHSSGFWGLSRQIPTGALTLDDPKIPCQCPPPQTKILDPPLLRPACWPTASAARPAPMLAQDRHRDSGTDEVKTMPLLQTGPAFRAHGQRLRYVNT